VRSGTSALRLELLTPEHVTLPFEVAAVSQRFLAMIVDLFVMGGLLLGVVLLLMAAFAIGGTSADSYIGAIAVILFFLIRNFYFSFSELRWQGQTFGKRRLGLRVVARDGGPLSAEMVLSRNLTRDIEHFLPVIVLFSPELILGEAPGWTRFGCLLWLLLVAVLPLFNRQRARLGDLVAGTVVVVAPRGVLLPDLVHEGERRPKAPEFSFTREQLDIYGIEELQVLEEVLRRDASDELYGDICERIKRKIGWSRKRWDVPPEAFLRAFYAAQRARLEQKMLLGKRQERKIR